MHLTHQYNAAYFSGLVQNRCTYTTPLTFLAWYRIDAPTHQYKAAYFSGLVQNRCTYHTNTTPLTFLAWYRIDAPNTPIQRRLLFWLGTESMHLSHQYNAAYFSGWVKNRCTYHTNTTPLTFLAWYRIDAPNTPIQRRLLFWLGTRCTYTPLTFLAWYRIDAPIRLLFWLGTESMHHLSHRLLFWLGTMHLSYFSAYFSGTESMHLSHQYNAAHFSGLVQNRCTYHTNTTPLTFLAWYRIDAPITPIQRRLLFWLGTESMHLSHQYNAAYFSGLVQNRCTYHTNTTPLTFLAWYRIDAPITPIQRRLLFWLGTKSMHLSHQYNAAYFSGLVQNRCT